jgi:hypothetical protein
MRVQSTSRQAWGRGCVRNGRGYTLPAPTRERAWAALPRGGGPHARLWAPPIPILARGLSQWDVHSKRPPEGGLSGADRKPGDRNR